MSNKFTFCWFLDYFNWFWITILFWISSSCTFFSLCVVKVNIMTYLEKDKVDSSRSLLENFLFLGMKMFWSYRISIRWMRSALQMKANNNSQFVNDIVKSIRRANRDRRKINLYFNEMLRLRKSDHNFLRKKAKAFQSYRWS